MPYFLCECNDAHCRELIEMSVDEYWRTVFLGKVAVLSRRCKAPVTELILEEHEEFIVVKDELE